VTLTLRMGKHSQKPLIWVTFPHNEPVIDRLKEVVPGVRWDRREKMWTAPLDMDVARDIREVGRHFNSAFRIEPELADWAKAERTRLAGMLRPDAVAGDYSDRLPNLQRRYPKLYSAMQNKPWQIPGAAFIVEQRKILLADQPRLGKTLQALAAVAELDIRGAILVVAPKTAVAVTWPQEIAQWLGPAEHVFVINAATKPEERKRRAAQAKALADQGERVWVITGPNYLRIKAELNDVGNYLLDAHKQKIIRVVGEAVADLLRMSFTAVIVDESQNMLACNTGNKKKWSAQRLGIGAIDIVPGSLQIAISGTPFHGKTEMIWGTLNWLDPKKYSSYWKWVKRHYGVTDEFHAEGETHLVKGDVIHDEAKFFSELRQIMVRRTYAELRRLGYNVGEKFYGGTHLVPDDDSTPIGVWLPMDPRQAKQYRQIQDDAVITIDMFDGTTDEVVVNGSLAEMTRLKQVANSCLTMGSVKAIPAMPSNKIDWILDFLREQISAGTKTVVVSQFTQFLSVLSEECTKAKIDHYRFDGGTSEKNRAMIKYDFQADEGDMVILLNTIAGGVSLDLSKSNDVVVADQTWIPDDQEQVEFRALHVDKSDDVRVWNLFSLGTIDEDIAKLNMERENEIFSVIDTQRGVTYVKQLVQMTKQRVGAKVA
jgi:SNF2 family DNA or RNA helicase